LLLEVAVDVLTGGEAFVQQYEVMLRHVRRRKRCLCAGDRVCR
jgi:hypothetical protein